MKLQQSKVKMNKLVSDSLTQSQLGSINTLIDQVGKRQISDFGNLSTQTKPDGSLITSCDLWSDQTIVNEISKVTNGEGVLSEEGSKEIPESDAYWVVDPLDGTTNFAAGIPYWAISIARYVNGVPQTAFLDIPPLKKRIIAIRGKGVWVNGRPIDFRQRQKLHSSCISLCSRSIRILQRKPDQPFPGKIRLLGVASLNMVSVGIGQTTAALEATPKIWDLSSAWLVLSELKCPIKWLERDPSLLKKGEQLNNANFPVLVANSAEELERLLPWAEALTHE